jgi:hypothetical protein
MRSCVTSATTNRQVKSRKLILQRRTRVNYLCVANGTTIPTYGWLPLSLNLGLRRDFIWRFVVADVTQPLIGADFLSNYGLLVDSKYKRLLDGVTSLSAPAQAANSRIPGVKVVSASTPVDNILSEFQDITRSTGVQREVLQNTVHHNRTTPGPSVACRPRRLAPDRLAIAKAQIDAMLRDGTARSQWLASLRRLQSAERSYHSRHHSRNRGMRPLDWLDIPLRLTADDLHRLGTSVWVPTLPLPGEVMWYPALPHNCLSPCLQRTRWKIPPNAEGSHHVPRRPKLDRSTSPHPPGHPHIT